MHVVKRNHENTFNYILDTYGGQEEEKKDEGKKIPLVKDSVDEKGWTLVHHIVQPLEFGSYENAEILKRALEEGFVWDKPNPEGLTPYQMACRQKSGKLKEIFERFFKPEQLVREDAEMPLNEMLGEEGKKVNFEEDAA